MKLIRYFTAVSFIMFAGLFIDAAAQNIDLSRQVEKSILKLPRYEVFDHINHRIEGSTVVLTGKVRNAINKSDAEAAVRRVPGVTNVVNHIEILPVGSYDESIRRNLYAAISRAGGLSRYLWPVNPDVRLIVERGHVTLEGKVYNRGDYDHMNIVARSVFGVFSVTNNLRVEGSQPR